MQNYESWCLNLKRISIKLRAKERVTFSVLILMFFLTIPVQPKPSLTWYAYSQPPAYIFEGVNAEKGYINLTSALLKQHLLDFTHKDIQASVGRIMRDLRAGKPVCVYGLFRTPEREKFVYYSKHALLHRNVRIMMTSSRANELKLGDKVSLVYLLEDLDLELMLIHGRSYGPMVDNIVFQNPDNVFYRASSKERALFKMLDTRRFDFMLAYPSAALYAIQSLGLKHKFQLIEIEGQVAYAPSSIGCSKTDWGRTRIKRINQALSEVLRDPRYFEAMSYWTHTMPDQREFRRHYQRVLIDNNPPPPLY